MKSIKQTNKISIINYSKMEPPMTKNSELKASHINKKDNQYH